MVILLGWGGEERDVFEDRYIEGGREELWGLGEGVGFAFRIGLG